MIRLIRSVPEVAILGALCVLLVADEALNEPLPADMHEWALESIAMVYKERFKEAENQARRIVRRYPDHPAGYFFFAAVLDARMERSQSDGEETQFYHYCDLAIAKGEQLLEKEPDNDWARFFIAGANGAKGTYESRYGRWITAFRHGWQGVAIFKQLQQNGAGIPDVLYGIATYDFWRSALTKVLWWMPGVEDRRDEAIAMLYEACSTAIYVKDVAKKDLVKILNYQKRYKEALVVADELLERYPGNLVLRWGRAEALLGLGKIAQAEKEYVSMRALISRENFDAAYNEFLVLHYIAKIHLEQERYAECLSVCKVIDRLKLSADNRKRLEKQIGETGAMKKEARSRLK